MAMDEKTKLISLNIALLIAISTLSLLSVKPTFAQTKVTNPSIPSFGLIFEPHTYYVSPTYGVDPSTGKAIMTNEGYYKIDRYVILGISNQPFQAYTDAKGNSIDLYYGIRWKLHSSESWQNLLSNSTRLSQNKEFHLTAIPIGFKNNPDRSGWYIDVLDYVPGNEYDFQVKSSIGYYSSQNQFMGQTSNWSGTQTITVPEATSPLPTSMTNPSLSPLEIPTLSATSPLQTKSPTQTPSITSIVSPSSSPTTSSGTPSPTQPSSQVSVPIWLYAVTVAMALVIGVLLGVVVMMRRRVRANKSDVE